MGSYVVVCTESGFEFKCANFAEALREFFTGFDSEVMAIERHV